MSVLIPPLNWGGVARGYEAAREPDLNHMFTVLVSGMAMGDFNAVSGISKEVETESIAEGGRTGGPRTLIKGFKPGTVTLKWGNMDRTFMWDWINSVRVGPGALGIGTLLGFRREVTVVQLSRNHEPYRVYHFHNAFPTSLKVGDLDVEGAKASVEELSLAYDSVTPLMMAQDTEASIANMASAARSAM